MDPAAFGDFLDRHGFLSWLGIEIDDAGEGWVQMRVPFDDRLLNPGHDTIHGGVAATLIDTASGFALRTTFADPASARLTTTDLDVKYLRPANDDLVAHADVVRAGRTMGVTEVRVEAEAPDGEMKAVAVGGTSYRLFRDD